MDFRIGSAAPISLKRWFPMMKRLVAVIAAFGLVLAACGGGTASCEDIADDMIVMVQDVIDEVDGMSEEELAAVGAGDAGFDEDFEQRTEELQQEADEAGCDDAALEELFTARAGSLTAESEFGQFFVEMFSGGELFEN